MPAGKLLSAMKETFRTVAIFKETMEAAAMSTFGSGWAWLVHDGTRVLIVTTTNQDSPISDGLTPLLGVDVWEHAYYLDYNNRRAEYVQAWFNVIDWDVVAARYAAAPVPDVSDILERTVSITGKMVPFGEIDVEAARTQASELGALTGWGPMAKVGSIARAWTELVEEPRGPRRRDGRRPRAGHDQEVRRGPLGHPARARDDLRASGMRPRYLVVAAALSALALPAPAFGDARISRSGNVVTLTSDAARRTRSTPPGRTTCGSSRTPSTGAACCAPVRAACGAAGPTSRGSS